MTENLISKILDLILANLTLGTAIGLIMSIIVITITIVKKE